MEFLTPLGLLGLIAIVVLILIYIIKPNYQQKTVSSTHVWKLSLKYRKKRLPISKLRNILLIICQVLILTFCAVILTQPNKILKDQIDYPEVIAIIDSSASMRTVTEKETRYKRAMDSVLRDFDALPQDGVMSVIIADNNPYFLVEKLERIKQEDADELSAAIQRLLKDETACSYGSSNIDAAMARCEGIIKNNPNVKINLYTDVSYSYTHKSINVVSVTEEHEWNAAILNAHAEIEENYYAFYVDIACYGSRAEIITLKLEVQDANAVSGSGQGAQIVFNEKIECQPNVVKTVIFKYFAEGETRPNLSPDSNTIYHEIKDLYKIYSYQSVYITLDVKDSFDLDNKYEIYGGQREAVRIQYASTLPNTFFNGILFVLQSKYKDLWDIKITEVKKGDKPATSGFDFYIFEHAMPSEVPTDGIVFLVNPDGNPAGNGTQIPSGFGVTLKGMRDFSRQTISLTQGMQHPILKNVTADNINVTRYVRIIDHDISYKVLMTCDTDPVLLIKDEGKSKVVILSFSLHYSDFALKKDFALFMLNMFECFFPATVPANSFEVYEDIPVNARGSKLEVTDRKSKLVETFEIFPNTLTTTNYGVYTLTQTTDFDKVVTEKIYIKIPVLESNIWRAEDNLTNPYNIKDENDYLKDLLIFIAAALWAILFLEWLLHTREKV